ncbi:DUF4166 domain-containing protein [Qipengyuania sp. S6317L1]|uniref:SDR family oxidoreductase n=1 Tax=Qipengyuania sp. S6317L1 TaxID=2926410 RepID=UPI001FF36556|nr:SDR family oxidoreductase [Qipengyuania sp. S6317L1]MCK0098070.1 DUF4166 domain-containing protein [Qipengyuania sp. S6317L1]
MKVLILGGYGVFGGRLTQLLSDVPDLTIFVAGRDKKKATAFCASQEGATRTEPYALDRRDTAEALKDLQPDLLVDGTGPFQQYGEAPYGVVEACIDAGVNYLDFADGADFVLGISRFDKPAKKAGIYALSGVSSFPVLTAAVLREFAKTMDIEKVSGGIAPSPYAGIGLNVMRAVVGYAGAPVKLRRDGSNTVGVGLAESRRFTIAVPGRMPLRNIHFSLVDVPDLQVIPPQHPTMTDIWMGAGPVPEALHRALNFLAKVRHLFRLPSLVPFSRLFYSVLNIMRFGEHRGGMFVTAKGCANGRLVEQSWHLLAEANDGPLIPSMAIEVLIRKAIAGNQPEVGARPAVNALDLSDYDLAFKDRKIFTGIRDDLAHGPIYRTALGSAFYSLPPQVIELHDSMTERQWVGTAEICRGTSLLAKIVAFCLSAPPNGDNTPVTVTFKPDDNGELWTRNFGGKLFKSHQRLGKEKNAYLIVEKFGPIDVALAPIIEEQRFRLVPRRWSVFGIPLPKSLLPEGNTFESQEGGLFKFDVEIAAPLVGLICSYRGTLRQQSQSLAPSQRTKVGK